MGPLQTYFFLAIEGALVVIFGLLMVLVGGRQLRKLFESGMDPLLAWLITGALVFMFLFIVVGGAGILAGMVLHGSNPS